MRKSKIMLDLCLNTTGCEKKRKQQNSRNSKCLEDDMFFLRTCDRSKSNSIEYLVNILNISSTNE